MIVLNKVTRNVPAADKAVYSSNTGTWTESPLVKGFLKWRTILGHFFWFCLFGFGDRISPCSPGYPRTPSVN